MRKIFALATTLPLALSACSGYTYLRDGTDQMSDGTYGRYAGTCTEAATVDPTTWFMPPVCIVHTADGREVVISGHNAAESSGAFLEGAGSLASVVPAGILAGRWRPDEVNVSANAPTSVQGGSLTATNYAAGGVSSSSSRSRGGNATATGGNGYGGAGGNASASPIVNSTSRAASSSASSARARNTNNNSQVQWQGQCQGGSVSGSNCGDP